MCSKDRLSHAPLPASSQFLHCSARCLIAGLTIDCCLRHVPATVPGIVFLSGGQSEVQATENLNAINRIGGPWPLSFSYGRALQQSALKVWAGDPANAEAAQAAFVHRARMNSLAVAGEWSAEMEQPVTA